MHWWIVGLGANAVITLAYLSVAAFLVVPLVRGRRLGTNKLGVATAAVLSTCAVHHGVHAFHLLMPSVGVDVTRGLATRAAWGWELVLWDLVGAAVALCCIGLRRGYGSLVQGAQLVDDLKRRERHALEINDDVLQGLVVAKMALELGQQDKAVAALDTSIASASRIISSLLDTEERPVAAGLLRTNAAVLDPADPSTAGRSSGGLRTPLGRS